MSFNSPFMLYLGLGFRAAAAISGELPPSPSPHVMDILLTKNHDAWIATEGKGIYRSTDGKTWQPMHTKPGYPASQNAYTLAEDSLGRIWVGTDCEGAVVWNGQTWQRYLPMHGPGGEHINDIAVSSTGRYIALATSGGISVYNSFADKWLPTATRASGLPEDQAAAVSFDAQDRLHAAFPCGGTSTASPDTQAPYRKWSVTQTLWTRDPANRMRHPAEPCGSGLPSNMGNAILAYENRLWLGTCAGLARQQNNTWIFTRGADYDARNRGLYGGLPEQYTPASPLPPGTPAPDLLPEDHITALHPTNEGIWVGFRKTGAALINPDTMKIVQKSLSREQPARARWVRAFATMPNGTIYAATYGGGLRKIGQTAPLPPPRKAPAIPPPHPKTLPPSSAQELLNLSAQYEKLLARQEKAPDAYFAEEDWATRGDWCERYGRRRAVLCAVKGCFGNEHFNMLSGTTISGYVGYPRKPGEYLRHWIETLNDPLNTNILYNPNKGMRTEAEWDDHGEDYPDTVDGPDVWVTVCLPAGNHRISLYFYNPNGHIRLSGYRDYLLELRKIPESVPLEHVIQYDNPRQDHLVEPIAAYRRNLTRQPVLARTRVSHFAGAGVYKTFIARGPARYAIRICRNNSFNTLLNGIFIERLIESPTNLAGRNTEESYGLKPPAPRPFLPEKEQQLPLEAITLWSSTRYNRPTPAAWSAAREILKRTYNHAAARYGHDHPLLENWRWELKWWLPQDRTATHRAYRDAWSSLQDTNILKRSSRHNPNSPDTVPLTYRELAELEQRKLNWRSYLPGKTPAIPREQLQAYPGPGPLPDPMKDLFRDTVRRAREHSNKKLPNRYE